MSRACHEINSNTDVLLILALRIRSSPAPSQLVRVDVRDISKAFVNMTDVEIAASQLKVTMRLDSRGFVQAANAVVHIPTTPKEKESVADKLKGLFSGSSKDEADKAEDVIKTLEAELEELEKSDKEKKVALKFSETQLGIKPLSAESKKQAKARLVFSLLPWFYHDGLIWNHPQTRCYQQG